MFLGKTHLSKLVTLGGAIANSVAAANTSGSYGCLVYNYLHIWYLNYHLK